MVCKDSRVAEEAVLIHGTFYGKACFLLGNGLFFGVSRLKKVHEKLILF
jgi:2-hydroxychromene-2-carboxylate isomerase